MQAETTKLTDSLERELSDREIAKFRGSAFVGGVSPLRPLLRLVGRIAAAMRFLRGQARRAKVDYVAG